MDRVLKVFGKKQFRGEGRKLGSSEKASKKNGNDVPTPSKADPARVAFSGKPHILSQSGGGSDCKTESSSAEPVLKSHEDGQPEGDSMDNSAYSSSTRPSTNSPRFKATSGQAIATGASEDLQVAVLQLQEGPHRSKEVLHKMLTNILRQPDESKYRKVRLANARIKEAIVDVEGALEVLQAVGFEMGSAPESEALQLVLPQDSDLTQLRAAAALLGFHQPSGAYEARAEQHLGANSTHAELPNAQHGLHRDLAKPCNRETQVLMPAAAGRSEDLPDWVYKRSPAELKAAMQAAQRKQQQDEMLMTRAMRERLQVGKQRHYTSCTVRIKLPEGLLLRGRFNGKEAVETVFEWVTDCLQNPGLTYDLILPDRRPLTANMGTFAAANLLPSVLLLFRPKMQTAQKLTLKSDILLTVKDTQ